MTAATVHHIDELAEHWTQRLLTNQHGRPKALLANAITAFRFAPAWRGALAYDAFGLATTLTAAPPWEAGHNRWQYNAQRLLGPVYP